MGRFIDIQILKYPEILKALEYLSMPHDKSRILKNYFNIKEKYKSAKPGIFVPGPSIGRSLLKRRDKFKIVIEPKGECEIERLIAKIYYEFIYFVEDDFIFHKAPDLQPIFDLIDKGETSKIFYFSRQKPQFESPIAFHLIRFIFRRTYQQLYISFFGILDFLFMTFYHHENFWDKIEEHSRCKNINGIHYEQNVKTGEKNFGILIKKITI